MDDDPFDDWLEARCAEAEADDGRLLPGTMVGAYQVELLLGRGGFAEVYSAKSPTGERVAVKLLHRLDAKSRQRFEREADILAQIRHPNIARLLSFGSCGNRPYIVTELLGVRELPNSDAAVARLVRAVCAAAGALHAMGYVHRDIKPNNVLWRGEMPVLVDFGLACLKTDVPRPPSTISFVNGQQVMVGTVGFSAPEQFAGGKIDAATDVHAIGMFADACFDGKPPRCWRRIIERATNSRGSSRYPTAAALSRRIALRHFVRNVVGVLVVVAAALWVWWWRWEARQLAELRRMDAGYQLRMDRIWQRHEEALQTARDAEALRQNERTAKLGEYQGLFSMPEYMIKEGGRE